MQQEMKADMKAESKKKKKKRKFILRCIFGMKFKVMYIFFLPELKK